jgi:EpsI family protein
MRFLNSRYAAILTAVLLLQAGAYYAVASRPEQTPNVAPLSLFPMQIGEWHMARDYPIEPEVQDVLKADDTLNRAYIDSGRSVPIFLFMAFFKTQRAGQAPHSPKNCLPGAGWTQVESGTQSVAVPGRNAPILINRYVVQQGDELNITFYWYQSHSRVIASEYEDRLWLIADAIRYNRSDTALVRVSVPVAGEQFESAGKIGIGFIQALFPELVKQLPI